MSRTSTRGRVLGLMIGFVLVGSSAAASLGITPHARAAGANGMLTIGWAVETKTLDPAGDTQNPDIWVQKNMYDELVEVGANGKTIVPGLASSWSSSQGGKVYTFHLRNATFQDGTPVTAQDVKFCIDRARQKGKVWAWTLKAVKNVAAPNKSTVVVTLLHPWGPFLSDMSLFNAGIYPKADFQKVGASGMATHPIGSGPYMFQSWKKGQYLRLTKYNGYWDAKDYPLKGIEFDLIPNDNTRLLKVEAGELDVDNVLPFNLIQQANATNKAQVQINPSTETLYIVPKDKGTPFADVHVRQAINNAIDREGLVRAVLFGHGVPASSFMPKGALWWNPNVPVPKYDLALAKSELAKSKYPHGFTITMEVPSGDQLSNQIDVILKNELASLGIKLNLKQEDPTTLFNNQEVGKYHVTNNLWTNDIPDPDELVSFAADTKAGDNDFWTYYTNTQLTNLAESAEKTNNDAQRQQTYFKIQQIFSQVVPFYPLFYVPFVNAVSPQVHHFSENPLGYFNLKHVTTG